MDRPGPRRDHPPLSRTRTARSSAERSSSCARRRRRSSSISGSSATPSAPAPIRSPRRNIPVLTRLGAGSYGFESPFKADVFFVTTRAFTGNQWGTSNPIMTRDKDFGVVRLRAFGTYDFEVVDPRRFLEQVAGTDDQFQLDEFAGTHALAHRRRIQRRARRERAADSRGRGAVSRARRRAAAARQPGVRRQVRRPPDQLRRRERVGAARGRGSARQADGDERHRQHERLREVSDGPAPRARGHERRRQSRRRNRRRHDDGEGPDGGGSPRPTS